MKTLARIVFFLFFFTSCKTQNPTAPAPQIGDRIGKNIVSIYNQSANNIKILLGDSISGLDTFMLKGKETWSSQEYQRNPIVKIKTDTLSVVYTLNLGFSYLLFWNDEKKYWDIKKIKK